VAPGLFAALSGSQSKATGFAGGYLLALEVFVQRLMTIPDKITAISHLLSCGIEILVASSFKLRMTFSLLQGNSISWQETVASI